MGQAISNFVSSICGDTGQDDFQGSTWPSPTHIFPQRPDPQLIPTPLSWSRGSDSFTHPVTNYVANRIVRNPPLGSDPDGDSTSWTREVSQLGLGHLATRDESDSVRQLGRDLALSWSRRSDSFTALSWSSEESEVLKEVRERDEERETFPIPIPIPIPELRQIPLSSSHGSDLFADLVTNSVSIPPPGSDPVRNLISTSSESDSVSQLGLDPVFSSPKWLEEFLGVGDSSITVGTDTIEESAVLKEVRERETFPIPIPIPIPELLQIPLSSSHGSDLIADLVTHSIPIPPPGSDPVRDSTSPSSESDSVSQLCRDPAITLPKWLDVFLRDSAITVLEEEKEVVREVLREERERDEERGGGGGAKLGRVERWMKHYSSFQKILLVGEGDFSFSACLAVAFGCAHNIIATSLDSREFLSSNYMKAMSNIESLTSRGAKVMHGVDATQMAKHFVFDGITFDRIVYNFPHGGFFRDESRETQLRRQRKLVRLFMKNAKKMIDKRGEIHVSHKSNAFFREWNLEQLATNEGLRLIESLHFRFTDYPGYHTKYGFGGDKNFNCNPSKTYKFGLKI